jgi:hypothetical protein
MIDEDGREVPGTRGYKYFGRAKDLPGVKELFQRGGESQSPVFTWTSLEVMTDNPVSSQLSKSRRSPREQLHTKSSVIRDPTIMVMSMRWMLS